MSTFSNCGISDLIFIELCAGSAVLSSAFRFRGFQVVPIDWKNNKHQQKTRCLQIDLASEEAEELVLSLLTLGKVFYVHCGPPCGTASAARSRPIDPDLLAQGAPYPRPLRTAEHPLGLPTLEGISRQRVETANRIYWLVSRVVETCIKLNILVSVENPANSLFWQIPFISKLTKDPKLSLLVFHSCMHGGERKKETAWLATARVFDQVALKCDNNHRHLPWELKYEEGAWNFDTAKEAQYPQQLCVTVTDIAEQWVISMGAASLANNLEEADGPAQKILKTRAYAGKTPRGRILPQMISEFSSVFEIVGEKITIPYNCKLLRTFLRKTSGEDVVQRINILGQYRTPKEFFDAAMELKHPVDQISGVEDATYLALFDVFTHSPSHLAKKRLETVKNLKSLEAQLKNEEKRLHDSLEPGVAKILEGKNLLLFKRLLTETEYPDKELVDDICRGFDLVGRSKATGIYPSRLIPATSSTKELKKMSHIQNKLLKAYLNKQGDAELQAEVLKQSQEEVQKGWIRGPLSQEQLDSAYPEGWLILPRFGLKQKQKVRNIDDGRISGLNTALTTCEKLRLMDIDSIAVIIKEILTVSQSKDRRLRFALTSGKELVGTIHSEWTETAIKSWTGRTLDLQAAYKQLPVSPETRWSAIVAIKDPHDGGIKLFESLALPFGSTASVYSFNRTARALWHLLTKLMSITCTQFYDDFPMLEPRATATTAKLAGQSLLRILGWKWADGEKLKDYEVEFNMLGVVVNLEGLAEGKAVISNKPSRLNDILEIRSAAVLSRKFTAAQAAETAGKLQFAEAQILGRAILPALGVIRQRAHLDVGESKLTDDICIALDFACYQLANAKPRTISISEPQRPIVIFTDGASEDMSNTWGAVIRMDDRTLVASGTVPQFLVEEWKENKTAIILEVELYPILLIKRKLCTELSNRKLIYFIDNDSARDGLISGSSKAPTAQRLLFSYYDLERLYPTFSWYSRVPSKSNPADDPSRGVVKETLSAYRGELIDLGSLSSQDLWKRDNRAL